MSDPQTPHALTRAVARAHANIALVKYWGKRDRRLNLPCTGSLSLTLAPLRTTTEVVFDPALDADRLELDGAPADPRATARVCALLDVLRAEAGATARARVRSRNDFPTAAGLASSASAFAALVTAADAALGLRSPIEALSALARRGSGSAARSLFGGFCEMRPGARDDGADAHAVPLADADHWPLSVVVALVSTARKDVPSTDGMIHTLETSPYFRPWTETVDADLLVARAAIAARDFNALGLVSERSCLRMHASALAADPGVLYWTGPTVELIHAVRRWRADGLGVFFTIDAGPNVKVFCAPDDADEVTRRVADVPGVAGTLRCAPGAGAHLLDAWPEEPA